jgi:ActR/RegA family two-component response regulator
MKNIRLLIVDDEDDFRNTLAKRLTKKGIVPEQAENGDFQALRPWKEKIFALFGR